jgi:hypothetical protein
MQKVSQTPEFTRRIVLCSVVGSGFTGTMSLVMHVQRSTTLGLASNTSKTESESLAVARCINIAAQYSHIAAIQ